MPAITYQNIFVATLDTSYLGYYPLIPATSLTIQYQNKLEESRLLGSVQPNGHRVGGSVGTNISMTFPVFRLLPLRDSWVTSSILTGYTGDVSTILDIGGGVFESCYLNSLSIDIQPFAPVMMTAEFSCLHMPTGVPFVGSPRHPPSLNYVSGIAYGQNAVINGGTSLSDNAKQQMTYKVSCNRTPVFELGSQVATKMFLDSVTKELSIKSTNVGALLNQYGLAEGITGTLYTDEGALIPSSGNGSSTNYGPTFWLSNAARITAQNLSVQDGGILAGDVTLKEVIR